MPILIPDYLVLPFPLASSKSGFEEIIGADLNYLKLSINNELIPLERILFNGASINVCFFTLCLFLTL